MIRKCHINMWTILVALKDFKIMETISNMTDFLSVEMFPPAINIWNEVACACAFTTTAGYQGAWFRDRGLQKSSLQVRS